MEGEMTMQPLSVDKGLAHSLKDDVYGMVLGVMFIAVGLNLLKCSGIITGGIAGIALLLAHVSSLPIGVLFFLANLPFLVFSYFFSDYYDYFLVILLPAFVLITPLAYRMARRSWLALFSQPKTA